MKKIILFCLAFFMTAGSLHAFPTLKKDDYVPGEVIIKYRNNFTRQDQTTFNAQVNGAAVDKPSAKRAFHTFFRTKVKKRLRLRDTDLVTLPAGTNVKQAIAEMKDNALIDYIEPNGRVYGAFLSNTYTAVAGINDTYYTSGNLQWWMNRINADGAYAAGVIFSGTSDIIVAVLDTGVDNNHIELSSSRLVPGYNFIGNNTNTDDDNILYGGAQIFGHGTHAAGMIVATINNNLGVAGLGWDNRIKVMPVKVLNSGAGGTFASIADGINYAVDNNALILNMSFITTTNSSTISTAVNYAATNNRIMVASAGNGADNMVTTQYYPACYASVISVGATTSMDTLAWYSNVCDPYNANYLDCVAPGGVFPHPNAGNNFDGGLTCTAQNGGWTPVEGTSFSAPQVAGLAALIELTFPGLTVNEVRSKITDNCDSVDTGGNTRIGQGRINILRSLSGWPTATATATATPTLTPSTTTTITPTVTPSSYKRDEYQVYPQPGRNYVRIAFNSVGTCKATLELYNVGGERAVHVEGVPQTQGVSSYLELATQDLSPGVYYFKLAIEDQQGKRQFKGKLAIIK